jgi:kynurenine formamidase
MPLDPASGNVVPPKIEYSDHTEGASRQGARVGLTSADMPAGLGSAVEVVTTRTHAGTHMDAPYHYYPTSGGRPSRRIDEVPLDWCVGPGVVLDFSSKPSGYAITPADLQAELERIGHVLQPGHIVLVRTGADALFWDQSYPEHQPGMSAQATRWLVQQGVRVMGIDAWSWDVPLGDQAQAYRASGNKELIWEGHRVGKEAEFCIVEQLGNLHALPRPTGFTACLFPVKVRSASAGWVRAVAIFEE